MIFETSSGGWIDNLTFELQLPGTWVPELKIANMQEMYYTLTKYLGSPVASYKLEIHHRQLGSSAVWMPWVLKR
jgi:hypothetical protein